MPLMRSQMEICGLIYRFWSSNDQKSNAKNENIIHRERIRKPETQLRRDFFLYGDYWCNDECSTFGLDLIIKNQICKIEHISISIQITIYDYNVAWKTSPRGLFPRCDSSCNSSFIELLFAHAAQMTKSILAIASDFT